MDMIKVEKIIVGGEMGAMPQHANKAMPTYDAQHESMQCIKCLITFSTSKAQVRHMRKHHRADYMQELQMSNILFTCYKCDKSFTSSEELRQHQVIHNKEAKPFSCPKCNKRFLTLAERFQHRGCGYGKKRSVCVECGHVMFSSTKPCSHVTEHSQKPKPKKRCTSAVLRIPCSEDDCELIFPSIAALRTHKKEAHGPPSTKLHNSG